MIYAHGGGFIFFSAATQPFHDLCCRLSAHLPALVVSLEYRLTPEHRLRAAYDNAFQALGWLSHADLIDGGDCEPWLKECADFSRCFFSAVAQAGALCSMQLYEHWIQILRRLKSWGIYLISRFSVARNGWNRSSGGRTTAFNKAFCHTKRRSDGWKGAW